MLLLALTTFVIILLSFLASSMEASLFSVSLVQIEQMVEAKRNGALRLKSNKENIQDSISAIVVLNNLANISGSIIVGSIAADVFNELWLGIFSGGLTFVIILIGEVIPKTVGERYAPVYARITADIVWILRIAFHPFIVLIRLLTRPLAKRSDSSSPGSEEHITTLAKLGHRHGAILESENLLIRKVFHLNDILARDIMTPRTVVVALHADQTLESIEKQLYKSPFSRFPVYEEDLDDVIGIAYIRDLLEGIGRGKRDLTVREFTEEVAFVPDNAKADQLLKDFQRNREHFAVVIDEYGGMAGVITLEDILEQLVGEIVDEFDSDVDLRVKARTLKEKKTGKYEAE